MKAARARFIARFSSTKPKKKKKKDYRVDSRRVEDPEARCSNKRYFLGGFTTKRKHVLDYLGDEERESTEKYISNTKLIKKKRRRRSRSRSRSRSRRSRRDRRNFGTKGFD